MITHLDLGDLLTFKTAFGLSGSQLPDGQAAIGGTSWHADEITCVACRKRIAEWEERVPDILNRAGRA